MTPRRMPLRERAMHAQTWLFVIGSGIATAAFIGWMVWRWW